MYFCSLAILFEISQSLSVHIPVNFGFMMDSTNSSDLLLDIIKILRRSRAMLYTIPNNPILITKIYDQLQSIEMTFKNLESYLITDNAIEMTLQYSLDTLSRINRVIQRRVYFKHQARWVVDRDELSKLVQELNQYAASIEKWIDLQKM